MKRPKQTRTLRRVVGEEQVFGLWDARREKVWVVAANSTTLIGSAKSCNIVVDDTFASREHCRVVMGEDGSCWVEDLCSTNGTVVNGLLFQGNEVAGKRLRLNVGGFVTVGLTQLDAVGPDTRVMLRGRSITSVMLCGCAKYGSPEKAAEMLSPSASTIRRRRKRQLELKRSVI